MMKMERDSGTVTVELALGLVGVVAVMSLVMAGFSVALAQGQACSDAREAARGAIVGQATSPPGVLIEVNRDGDWATVTARREPPMGAVLGYPTVECQFRARMETSYVIGASTHP